MTKREAHRMTRELTEAERARWECARKEVESELPELIELGQRLERAAAEPTLSGQLRRAAHSSELSLTQIARKLQIAPATFSRFLAGEEPLPSDVLDRLTTLLGYELVPSRSSDQ